MPIQSVSTYKNDGHLGRLRLERGTPSSSWQAIRVQVLKRDKYRCQVQGPGSDGRGCETDHIVLPSFERADS